MDFTHAKGNPFTKQRAAGVAVVVAIHALLLGLLLRMHGRERATPEPMPLQVSLLKAPPPVRIESPSIEPRLRPPAAPSLSPPSLVIAEPAAPIVPSADTVAVAVAPSAASASRSTASIPTWGSTGTVIGDLGTAGMVRAKMDMTRSPVSCHNPAFPEAEDRNSYGLAAVSLLIGPDGGVKGSRIDATSGHPQLDRATIDAFSSCTYIRGTIRGLPAPTWYRIKWLWFLPRNQR